jgi:hypothetical protein
MLSKSVACSDLTKEAAKVGAGWSRTVSSQIRKHQHGRQSKV